jgi:hypothetical protein
MVIGAWILAWAGYRRTRTEAALSDPHHILPVATPAKTLTSMGVVAVVAFVYLVGLVALCRASLVAEAAISLAFPLWCIGSGWIRHPHPRLLQLLAIESFYNLLVVTGKTAIVWELPWLDRASAVGFTGFFVLQLGAFVAFQVKVRSPHGVLQSVTAALLMGAWWLQSAQMSNAVDGSGRFLMWGGDAPLAVAAFYVVWVVNVMFVDSPTMPWLRVATIHVVSVLLALFSGEFFHVRVLTACHLFVLDLVFGFGMSAPEAFGRDFAVVPHVWQERFRTGFQPALAWICTLGCLGILAASWVWGLDLAMSSP